MCEPERTKYFYTFVGQLEYCLMRIFEGAFRVNLDKFPSTYFGAYNAIQLYLSHPSYSPFVEPFRWMKKGERDIPEWNQAKADANAAELKKQREKKQNG